ncbi:hypothetical protein COBT_003625 [Conglomerata obtusa]
MILIICFALYFIIIKATYSYVPNKGSNKNDISQSINTNVKNITEIGKNVILEDVKTKVAITCSFLLDRSVSQLRASDDLDKLKNLELSFENALLDLWMIFFDGLNLKLYKNIEDVVTHFKIYQNIIYNFRYPDHLKAHTLFLFEATIRLLSDCVTYVPKIVINGNLDDAYNYINNFCMLFKIEFDKYTDKSKEPDLSKELGEAKTTSDDSKTIISNTNLQKKFVCDLVLPNHTYDFIWAFNAYKGLFELYKLSNDYKNKDFEHFARPNLSDTSSTTNKPSLDPKNNNEQSLRINLHTNKNEELNIHVNPDISFEERRLIETLKKMGSSLVF